MKASLKLLVAILAVFLIPSAAMASIGGNAVPQYSHGQIFATNSTVDLIPSTSGSGNVWGVQCIMQSTGAAVTVKFTVDGGTTHSITVDSTAFAQEETGHPVSGWIPMNIAFSTSIHVQLNNTGLGTATTIDCWASWGTN